MEKYYQQLGINSNATLEEIKARYRFLIKVYHPDRYSNPVDKQQAEEELKKINEAYTALKEHAFNNEHFSTNTSPKEEVSQEQSNKNNRGSTAASPNNSDNQYTQAHEYSSQEKKYCQACGEYSFTAHSTYRKNIGLVFIRRYKEAEGDLCAHCNESLFWNAFLTNLFLGWWGVISFVINPFLILMNIGNYISSWKIRRLAEPYAKSAVDLKLFIPLMGLFIWLAISVIGDINNNTATSTSFNSGSFTNPSPTSDQGTSKNGSLAMEIPENVLYTTSFTHNDSEWDMQTIGDETHTLKDGKLVISTVKNSCAWSSSTTSYDNAVVKVTLVNSKTLPNDQPFLVTWRSDLYKGFYGLFIYSDGYVFLAKQVGNQDMVPLYTSEKPVIDFNDSNIPIYISFIGSIMSIATEDQIITSVTDASLSSGVIGLGLCTGTDNDGSVSFDDITIYGQDKIVRKPTATKMVAKPQATKTPVTQVNSTGKVLVTVINNANIPQEIYCEGIYIFNINPGETKTFRFQKGKWRIDLCYPGTFPCDNFDYVDLNYDEFTYEIRY